MTHSGSCANCGAPLASDQPHCAICGTRAAAPVSPDSGLPAAVEVGAGRSSGGRGIPVPPQVAMVAAVLALGFGGVVGSSIGPGAETLLAAAPTAAAPTGKTVSNAGGSGGSTTSHDSGGSGGGPSATAPASSPAPVAPAPAPTPDPAPADPAPADPAPADPGPSDPGNNDPLPPDDATTAQGTVVRVNPAADSYSLASGGALSTIHAKDLPEAGKDVSVLTTPLFNGTLEEAGDRKESAGAKQATFSGTVTSVDAADGLYVLSSAGASIPIGVGGKAGAQPDMPKLAFAITAVVNIAPAPDPLDSADQPAAEDPTTSTDDPATPDPDTCSPTEASPVKPYDPGILLTQDSFQVDFESLSSTGMEGIVQVACPDLNQIVVSADDLRESATDVILTIPKDVDVSALEPGDSVTANVDPTPADDGTVGLTGLAGDDGLEDADDKKLGQGDKAG